MYIRKCMIGLGVPFLIWSKSLFQKKEEVYDLNTIRRSWGWPEKVYLKIQIANGHVESGMKTGKQILREMSRFELVQNIVAINDDYEGKNIFERWLITAANDQQPGDYDPIFDNRKLTEDYPVTKKMIEETTEKGFTQDTVDKFLELSKKWIVSQNEIEYVNITFIENVMKLECNTNAKYVYVFPQDLFIELLNRGSPEQLGCVVLRYACILQQAQHWAKTVPFYKMMFDNFGINLEGFASPLNSRMILANPTGRFCSLFPDVDKHFGSIGSFFDLELHGKFMTVNPPYIESVFDRILVMIKDAIAKCTETGDKMVLSIGLPRWLDSKLINFLEHSEYTKYISVFNRDEYTYTDTKYDTFAPATFKNQDYILSVNVNDSKQIYERLVGTHFARDKTKSIMLAKLRDTIKRTKDYDFSKIGIRMTNFYAKYIADILRFNGMIDDIVQLVPEADTLVGHIVADALLYLDPKNTMKYNRAQIISHCKKMIKYYLGA